MSEYIRRVAIYGIIVVYPEDEWKAIHRIIGKASSNINQIAVRCNSLGKIYVEDMQDIKKSVEEMNQTLFKLYHRLSQIR